MNHLEKIKLNVGTSPIWRKDGWLALDHKPSRVKQRTILGDANNIPLKPKECSTIFCSHVIEHIPQYKFEDVLVEFNRVLEKNGIIRILTPDLYKLAKAYVENDQDFLKKMIIEDENVRTDLGYGGTFMNFLISPGQDTVLFNRQISEFIAGYGHVYLYDFEMLSKLLERYGFSNIQKKEFCDSEYDEYKEPLHVEGMEPVWIDLNKEFFNKHDFVHIYNEKTGQYETNFTVTGFDRDPETSLIVEAKKGRDVIETDIKDVRNFNYSKSLLNEKKFQLKYEKIKSISQLIDSDYK